MRVTCPSCSAAVPAEDVNITRLVAKCRSCGAVFSFEDQVRAGPAAPPVQPLVPQVPLPPGITVEREGGPTTAGHYREAPTNAGSLRITRRWFAPQSLFLTFFSLVWFGFLGFWYTTAFQAGAPWIMFVFPLLHVGVGLGVAYTALTGLLNKTLIELKDGVLSVRHGPIPARGNRTIPASDIRQLYTEQQVSSKGALTYDLNAVVARGPVVKLAKGLESSQQALAIERLVEEHLGIVDQPVAGAVNQATSPQQIAAYPRATGAAFYAAPPAVRIAPQSGEPEPSYDERQEEAEARLKRH
ncbi:MAG: hypothetical protein IPM79_18530 [Polyangiaceae bacterium]|jgi:hypothetical protein|nr:hypothetical protein [Polyangiaceae bacterium]